MDYNFDKGTTKLLDGKDGEPVLVESGGFPVFVRVDTQEQARALKTEMRERGFDAQYGEPIAVRV
jgi:hypothetical protein